jgi:hypothetical protein
MGVLNGGFEMLFEKYELEHLLGADTNMVKAILNQAFTEGIGEGATTIANTMADIFVMAENSEWQKSINEYIANGYSPEDAKKQAFWDAVIQVGWDAVGGMISGGVMGGGSSVINTIVNTRANTENVGQNIIDNRGYNDLRALAESVSAEAAGIKSIDRAIKKADAKTTARTVGKLSTAVETAKGKLNKADIQSSLEGRGMSKFEANRTASKILEVAEKQAAGIEITQAEYKAVTKDKVTKEVYDSLISDPKSTVNTRNAKYANARQGITIAEDGTVTRSEDNVGRFVDKVVEGIDADNVSTKVRFKANTGVVDDMVDDAVDTDEQFSSDDVAFYKGKTTYTNPDTGETQVVKIEGISSIKDGEMMLKLGNGETVSAENVNFASKGEALVYSSMLDLGVNAGVAEALVKNFKDAGYGDSQASKYALGMHDAYLYGTQNIPLPQLSQSSFSHALSKDQREYIYKLGLSEYEARRTADKAKQAASEAKVAEAKAKGTFKHKEGQVIAEDGVVVDEKGNIDESGLTDIQRVSLNGIKALASVSPINYHIFKSEKVNGRFVATINGVKYEGSPNGVYMVGTNDIWIDLNAGNTGEGTMLWTAAHEIDHFVKERSPDDWQKIADFIISEFSKQKGTSVSDMLDNQIAKIRKRLLNSGKTMTETEIMDEAYEDLVSDALSEMLVDGTVVDMLAKMKQEDKTWWEKFKAAVEDLLKRWGEIIGVYQERDSHDTAEAEALSNMQDAFKKVQRMYAEAFAKASEVESVGTQLAEAGIAIDEATGDLFSVRNIPGENGVPNAESIAKLVSEATGRSYEESLRWVQAEYSIANIILGKPEFLDFDPDNRYDFIKKNSDYPQGTVDPNNLCRKREEFTVMFDMLQRMYPNKTFTALDVADMRHMLDEEGITVACGACFVEDRRQLLGEIADTFIGMWKEAAETGKPLQKTNASGVKKNMTITAKLAKTYGLTKGATIYATDKYIPNQYDLTTYEGFKKLEREHPMIAYSFIGYNNSRGQQAARLIEGRAEYTRQILNWSDKKVQSVNNQGGLRIFSFSDFQAVSMLDIIQVIIDCSARGVKIQGYTKVPEFAKLIRNTGIKINRSLMPKGATGIKIVNGKKVLDYDTKEGIDINDEDFLDEADNPNVGNILVGINAEQISLAFLDDFVDYIIPFHTNKSKAVCEALGLKTWQNYKESQHEQDIASGKASKHNVNIYTQVINKYNPTNKVEFVDAFLKECRRQKKIPRYAEFLNKEYTADGAYTDEGGSFNYTYREGYHKLLVDFKMFDKQGNILLQGNVTPDMDSSFMETILAREVEKKEGYKFPQKVFDRIQDKYGEKPKALHSDRNSNGEKLSKEQAEFFKDSKVRDAEGNLLVMYHGTNTPNFTVFDPQKARDKTSLFFTSDSDVASSYSRFGRKSRDVDAYNLISEDSSAEDFNAAQERVGGGLRVVKITKEWIQEMQGKASKKAAQLLRIANKYNGIEQIREITSKGAENLTAEDIVTLRNAMRDSELYKDNHKLFDEVWSYKTLAATPDSAIGQYTFTETNSSVPLMINRNLDSEGHIIPMSEQDAVRRVVERTKWTAEHNTGNRYKVYLNLSNPYIVDAGVQIWNGMVDSEIAKYFGWDENETLKTEDVAEFAKAKGYDGVILKNITDIGRYDFSESGSGSTVVVAFNSEQVKSVDNKNPTSNPDIRFSERNKAPTIESLLDERTAAYNRISELRKTKDAFESSEEYNLLLDEIIKADAKEALTKYEKWVKQSKYGEVVDEIESLQKKINEINTSITELSERANAEEESKKIETSGLSEADYFRKVAVKEFGYTPFFYDAGYMLPNGKLLNFSGEKGKHFGSRGQDHRAIGIVYANETGGKAMLKFMSEGNIRVMAETPGLDISSEAEPTPEQYRTIKKFVREYAKEKYLAVDITDKNGNVIGTYDYENNINADRVVNDIKYFFENGTLRAKSTIADFRYSERVTDKKTLDFLNEQIERGEYITVYRSFQVIDGGLYAPMNAVDRDEDGKNKRLGYRSEIGKWEKATESKAIAQRYMDAHPDAPYAKFDLDGGDNKTGGVAYNPYLHASNLVLNDQFAAAYRRNLVTVECRVPLSEAEGAYKADFAKDGTGWANWKAGGVAGQLKKIKPDLERRLFLSRYMLPVRILSDAEVASMYKDYLDGTDISVPWNVVTPSLREELEKAGVNISYKDVKRSNGPLRFKDQFPEEASKVLYSERNTDSNRSLLANALETTVQNEVEANKLKEYKAKISLIDAEQQKLQEINAEIREISFSKGKRDTERLKSLRFEAAQTANRINTYDRQLLNLESTKVLKRVLEREKGLARKRQKAKNAETMVQYREKITETRDKREAVKKLQKLILDTSKWVSYPAKEDVKVPDILKVAYAEFLESIDLSSKRLLKGGEATLNDMKMASAMDSLANAIEKIKTAQNPTAETSDLPKEALDSGYLDLPANFIVNLRTTTDNIKKLMIPGTFVVNNMSSQDIKQISKLIRTLNHSIREMSTLYSNLRFAHVEEIGHHTASFLDELGEKESSNAVADFVSWDNALPYYAFKRFGEAGESIFEELMDGQDKLAFLAQEIFDFKNSKDKGWTDKEANEWGKDTHKILLPSGNTLTLTTADAMSIYCLSRREQGKQHLLGGGVRIVGITKGAKKAKDSKSTLTQEDIDAIISSLSERQIEVANAIQEFMSTTCAEWGNEISMKRFLTREFLEKYYFPIESSDENLPVKDKMAQQADLYRLLNISATKPLTQGANNAVTIRNIFEVFTNHASDMAKLNAFGMALLDYMKWVNYRESDTNDKGQIITKGVRHSMNTAYGDKAFSYVLNLIKDVNGRYNDGGDHAWLMKMTRSAKTAMVGNSLRVAVLQVTSYPRAGAVLSQKSLALALTKIPQIRKAQKYCGVALWKSFGFYDTNISRSIEDQIKGTTDIKQKLIEWSLKGASAGDALTWGCLWNACEYEVAKTGKYKVGTEEFNQAVGKKLREVVYATQVVDSTLTRSQIMRNKSGLTQGATAFMSEPTLSANILMDAGFKFHMEKRKSGSNKVAWEKTGKAIGKAVAVYSIGQLTAALVEGIMDAYRDDDDEEFYKKFLEAFKKNAITDLIPLTKIPIISDIAEFALSRFGIGYFSSDNLSTTWLSQAADAYDAWAEVLGKENTSKTVYNAIYNTTRALSSATGVAVAGLMREVVALWNNTAGYYDPTLKIKTYENTTAENGKLLYEAILEGNERQVESFKGQFEDEEAYKKALRNVVGEEYKNGTADRSTATKILSEHVGMEEDDIHWLLDKWDFGTENGSTDDYDKYDDFYSAVESGSNLKATIKVYLDNGVSEKTLAGQITSHFKPIYREMSNSERASLKGYLLNAYELLGKKRSEKSKEIDAWLKD